MTRSNLNIGEIGYPFDNSYCCYLDDESVVRPCGILGEFSNPVTITSKPYKKIIQIPYLTPNEHEFVNAMYDGREIRILNVFYSSYIAMVEHRLAKRFSNYWGSNYL